MKALFCISAVILAARLGAAGAESADYQRGIKPLFKERWVAQGAPSPAKEKPEPDPREHWAFQAPRRPPVPSVTQHASRITNPIDAFILAEQEKRGLQALPEERKDILLRRVYLDLIGLPPAREELHAFLSDTSANVYEKVVDRLLASREYAERWARHWMDIWRYADWYGRRHVPDVWNSAPQVWRWRDWIVRSLNADKGYDRMVVEMLAADEAAPDDDDTRVATGYLVRNWYALNPNQWMRDTVEHTGKAFLGLTFNCAHCHDHKYDPITQRDYFRFRAFFEPLQVRQDWVRGEPDPGAFQKYEYGATRKVITNGMVSVFDENLDARTFIYLRGDERNLPADKPIADPAMPAFLGGDSLKADRIDLPAVARYPGLKPFIREAELKKREHGLRAAKDTLAKAEKAFTEARAPLSHTGAADALVGRAKSMANQLATELTWRNRSNEVTVAEAELEAIRARIAADEATYGVPALAGEALENSDPLHDARMAPAQADEVAAAASRAERLLTLRKAEAKFASAEGALALLQAEELLTAARRSTEEPSEKKEDSAKTALKRAQEQVAAGMKNLEAARTALDTNSTAYTPLTPTYPAQSSGRRLALATWIVSRDNPLAARVAVNHIWGRHFHAPLVASVFDFGRNGARPTHPELLDWLAVEFMEHGWSMKYLHRLLVTSNAYRTASSGVPPSGNQRSDGRLKPGLQTDPENRWLWRMNPGQMEAEVVRDSILHLSGELDLTPVDYPFPTALSETNRHRSLYFECFPEPNGASQFAELFDAPNPTECYRRTQTIIPQQALALTNGKLSHECSQALARRLTEKLAPTSDGNHTGFITAAYEQLLARRPTAEELTACRDFLAKQLTAAKERDTALASLVHALFNHNDFVTSR